MKKIVFTALIAVIGLQTSTAQLGGMLKNKAKETIAKKTESASKSIATKNFGKSTANQDTTAMEGTWKVDGVIVTTEMEAMKNQLAAQEEQYNATYKGSIWEFKKNGVIAISMPKSEASPGGTGVGEYKLTGEKITMLINGQPGEYDLKFEDGQMLLINTSPLNTIYYVFVKV